MFTTREILYTAAVPAAITLLVLVVSWRPWRRGAVVRGNWGGALAAGASFMAAYALLDKRVPAWPPDQARHWIFYIAAGLTVLGLFDALCERLLPIPDWLRAEGALAAACGIVLCLFASLLRSDTWPPYDAARWLLVMAAVLHVAWVSAESLVTRLPRVAGPLVVFVFTAGVALLMMLSGSLVYGRMAGVLAVVALVASLLSAFTPSFSLCRGAVTVIVPVTVATLFLGYHLVEPGLSATKCALLLAALLLPWLAKLPPFAGSRPWVRGVVAVLLAAAPVGAAAWRARAEFLRMQQETPPGEFYTLRTT